jgi:hypothetical protein
MSIYIVYYNDLTYSEFWKITKTEEYKVLHGWKFISTGDDQVGFDTQVTAKFKELLSNTGVEFSDMKAAKMKSLEMSDNSTSETCYVEHCSRLAVNGNEYTHLSPDVMKQAFSTAEGISQLVRDMELKGMNTESLDIGILFGIEPFELQKEMFQPPNDIASPLTKTQLGLVGVAVKISMLDLNIMMFGTPIRLLNKEGLIPNINANTLIKAWLVSKIICLQMKLKEMREIDGIYPNKLRMFDSYINAKMSQGDSLLPPPHALVMELGFDKLLVLADNCLDGHLEGYEDLSDSQKILRIYPLAVLYVDIIYKSHSLSAFNIFFIEPKDKDENSSMGELTYQSLYDYQSAIERLIDFEQSLSNIRCGDPVLVTRSNQGQVVMTDLGMLDKLIRNATRNNLLYEHSVLKIILDDSQGVQLHVENFVHSELAPTIKIVGKDGQLPGIYDDIPEGNAQTLFNKLKDLL